MIVRALVAVALITALFAAASASAAVRINNDPGGQIGPYIDRFSSLRNSGEMVIIDGACLSACTMLLGLIPRDRICVTSRARLGFHAAWNPSEDGRRVISNAGTQALWDIYPREVRRWLSRRGGLKTKMIFLQGRELADMYQRCQ